jgi:hypothetical protein
MIGAHNTSCGSASFPTGPQASPRIATRTWQREGKKSIGLTEKSERRFSTPAGVMRTEECEVG